MSIQAINTMLELSESRLGARLVMFSLANHDGEAGCFVSIERIAKETHMSTRQVQRCLRELERMAELGIEYGAGPHGTNRYTFLFPQVLPMSVAGGTDDLSPDIPGPEMSPKPKELSSRVVVVPTDPDSSSRSKDPRAGSTKDRNPNQPTHDQLYLAMRLQEAWDQPITPAAIVRLNKAHGRGAVIDAMRQLHGFPPEVPIDTLYGYLKVTAKAKAAS